MKDSNLPDYYQSIFQQLFEHASDLECKLILLDEILEVGDQKEIPMLKKIINSKEDPILRNKAAKIKQKLLEKLEALPVEDEKLPISLCFLYDEFDISPPDEQLDPEIGFGISIEILAHEE
ncbi:hypothetical protein [Flagellimonas eckloniae]|uniref:Uncharacterized protein n=1 Tax=Flagellimonas eckloniae TaxID=346185 RepID=A0A0Q0XJW5_9FLAO|nr:hypothetical protein [Allomuricauda eckloniae]KQC29138.1 hypothetical protein AAY42_03930 [Allomuricauda eckloniae]